MLMRTPEQIALAETSKLCQEFAELSRDAAELTAEPRVRELMAKLIDEHERVQAAIDERLRALDDGPLSPDPELEGLKKLATRVKKMFAADESVVLLDEGIAHETQLLSHVREALKLDLSAATRPCLEDAERTASSALHLLSQERATHAS